MSIKETLTKEGTIYEQKGVSGFCKRLDYVSRVNKDNFHENFLKGVSLLESAGVENVLNELADIIREDYPDAEVTNPFYPKELSSVSDPKYLCLGDNTVSMMLCWDFADEPRSERQRKYQRKIDGVKYFKCLEVIAVPSRNEIIVEPWNRLGVVLKVKEDQTTDLLEAAVVEAYKYPRPASNRIIHV
jgi:hypothetical protein